MQAPRFAGIVRVTNTREEIEQATRIALDRKREGYSPEALVLAVDEILQNVQLSRAIVVYVQTIGQNEDGQPIERPFSWFLTASSVTFAFFCLWLVYVLFSQVDPKTDLIAVLLIVLCQGTLVRIVYASIRLAWMSACDGLNDASYPTKLHPLPNASSAVGGLRLKRLRALLIETADRILAGEKPAALEKELAEVNLTPTAAKLIVRLASISAILRGYLPPYEPRWLGYALAVAFAVTAIVFVDRVGDRLADGYKNYALGVAGLIAGELSARPRRRPRSQVL